MDPVESTHSIIYPTALAVAGLHDTLWSNYMQITHSITWCSALQATDLKDLRYKTVSMDYALLTGYYGL